MSVLKYFFLGPLRRPLGRKMISVKYFSIILGVVGRNFNPKTKALGSHV